VSGGTGKMDAYDLADKLKKYWAALYPKNSGELPKSKKKIRVVINTHEGYREVVGVHIQDDVIELELDKE
jgi:hypothetical protein